MSVSIEKIEKLIDKHKQDGTYIICALPIEADNMSNIFYSGLGKINAAMKSLEIIKSYQPKKILNYGSCGAINKKLKGIIKINKFTSARYRLYPSRLRERSYTL